MRRSEGEVQSIDLPVTGKKGVRVFRAGWDSRLSFRCGLVQAKVMNGILRGPVTRTETHRYHSGVNYLGQGALKVGVYLLQNDPIASLQATINRIADLSGMPKVDPGLIGNVRRMARRVKVDRTPSRHVVRSDSAGMAKATALANVIVNAKVWGGPVIKAGETVSVYFDGYKYSYATEDGKHTLILESGDFAKKGRAVHRSVSRPDAPLIDLADAGEARVYSMPLRV